MHVGCKSRWRSHFRLVKYWKAPLSRFRATLTWLFGVVSIQRSLWRIAWRVLQSLDSCSCPGRLVFERWLSSGDGVLATCRRAGAAVQSCKSFAFRRPIVCWSPRLDFQLRVMRMRIVLSPQGPLNFRTALVSGVVGEWSCGVGVGLGILDLKDDIVHHWKQVTILR